MFQLQVLTNGNWLTQGQYDSFAKAQAAYCVACGTVPEYKPYYWGLNIEGRLVMIPSNDPKGRLDMDLRIVCPQSMSTITEH